MPLDGRPARRRAGPARDPLVRFEVLARGPGHRHGAARVTLGDRVRVDAHGRRRRPDRRAVPAPQRACSRGRARLPDPGRSHPRAHILAEHRHRVPGLADSLRNRAVTRTCGARSHRSTSSSRESRAARCAAALRGGSLPIDAYLSRARRRCAMSRCASTRSAAASGDPARPWPRGCDAARSDRGARRAPSVELAAVAGVGRAELCSSARPDAARARARARRSAAARALAGPLRVDGEPVGVRALFARRAGALARARGDARSAARAARGRVRERSPPARARAHARGARGRPAGAALAPRSAGHQRHDRRRERRAALGDGARRAGRAHRRAGADPRRDRLGQGGGRARDPRALAPRARARSCASTAARSRPS